MKALFVKYKEIILYIFFGGCTTLVNLGVYFLMTRCFFVNEFLSNAAAWLLSVLFAFITNKVWVFESRSTKGKALLFEITSFFAARLLSLGIDMAVLWFGIEILQINDGIVKIVANIIVIIVNYIASKLFIFRKKKKDE